MKPITIVTVDDHHLIREGIRKILEEEQSLQMVGEGWAGEHVEQLLKEYQPDVLLLDISMPQWAGTPPIGSDNTFRALPTIAQLRPRFPKVHIIIISQYATPVLVDSAVELGVRGYLLKSDVFSRHLAEAIYTVMAGGRYFSESINRQIAEGSDDKVQLTLRQREVLQAVASNPQRTYQQHADQLQVSTHTFNHHLRQIFDRLQVNNITAAVVEAARLGLVFIDKTVNGENDQLVV